MANLSSILTDPNYVNANEATKQAIFDKFSTQDTNFTNANADTQAAIRQRFGVVLQRPRPQRQVKFLHLAKAQRLILLHHQTPY